MPFAGGRQTDNDGNQRNSFGAIAGSDVFINGTRYDNEGIMKSTVTVPPVAGDVFINGIRHNVDGQRYVTVAAQTQQIPGGLIVSALGQQYVGNPAGTMLVLGGLARNDPAGFLGIVG